MWAKELKVLHDQAERKCRMGKAVGNGTAEVDSGKIMKAMMRNWDLYSMSNENH